MTDGRYRLKLLGGLSLEGEKFLSGRVTQRRQLALLALLAAHPTPLTRDKLIGFIWPETTADRARHQLSDALYVIRKELGEDAVLATADSLQINDAIVGSDVAGFRSALAYEAYEEALASYRGPFLDGFFPNESEPYERWMIDERLSLERQAARAAWRLADQAEEAGDIHAAIRWSRRALEIVPADERGVRRLIRLQGAIGNRAGAVRTYQEFATELETELDVQPSEETQALIAAIREGRLEQGENASDREKGWSTHPDHGAGRLEKGSTSPRWTVRQAVIGAASILAVVVGIIGLWSLRSPGASNGEPGVGAVETSVAAVAVLPFRVQGEDAEDLREGMVDLLSMGLDEAGRIRAISPSTLFARWREVISDDQEPELSTRLRIARRTGARYAVIGSAIHLGSEMRLIASIYDLRTGKKIGQGQAEGPEESILPLVDRLAVEILRVILERGEEELPEIRLASLTTESAEALRAYLEGEVHFRHFELQAAEEAFERAIGADSTFALAHYRLADTYLWPTNPGGDPAHHLERAVALSDRLPEQERVLVKALHASQQRTPEAIESLRQLVQEHPENAEAWYTLADTYLHVPSAFATAQEIAAMFERAVELDPKNAKYLLHHVQFAWWQEPDSATAVRRLEMWNQAAPRHSLGPAGHLGIALAFGDSIARRRAVSDLPAGTEFEVVSDLRRLLYHPRYSGLQEVLEEFQRHREEDLLPRVVLFRYHVLWRGRLREGLAHLRDLPESIQTVLLYEATIAGIRPAEDDLWPLAVMDSTASGWQIVLAGALAADRARWSVHSDAVAELSRREERAVDEASEPGIIDWYRRSKRVLRAHRSWHDGKPGAALPTLADPQVLVNWTEHTPAPIGRWWLGRLYQEAGRLEDAERVYRSFHFLNALAIEPLAQYRLGKIYEELGKRKQAAESYEYFIQHWKDADPELRGFLEDARQGLIRTGVLRTG